MSDEETEVTSHSKVLTAEYRDGRLQIVEVTPFEKTGNSDVMVQQSDSLTEQMILPEIIAEEEVGQERKYMQVLDNADKGLVHLDLLNLTLVKCDDNGASYRLVANGETDGAGDSSEDTVTCVLQTSNEDDAENEEYVMMEGDTESLMLLQQLDQPTASKRAQPTSTEILEKVKAIQKAKALMTQASTPRVGKRGRKRKNHLPSPHELLASPNFKLFLYSCKLCNFKCNAVRELTHHKTTEHGSGSGKFRNNPHARSVTSSLQCARCPYRGSTQPQLTKHVLEKHFPETNVTNQISLDTKEVEEADVLVCGACGFESSSRPIFKRHIEDEHGATTT